MFFFSEDEHNLELKSSSNNIIDSTKLEYLSVIGTGYFCNVKKYRDKETGEFLSLKELKKEHTTNPDYCYRFNREIELLKQLQDCEYVIKLIGYEIDPVKSIYRYLMPFSKYNLFEYVRKYNNQIKQSLRFDIANQIIEAIHFAHNLEILHRDISPNNVLVFKDIDHLKIKVCDFSLGKDSESLSFYTRSSTTGYGQILYVSPEQRIKLKEATKQSDIYSLGKLIYFVFTGKDPDNLKTFELSSLVTKAIEENPQDRFKNIDDLLNHFNHLKKLNLDIDVPILESTFYELVESGKLPESWIELHEIFSKGSFYDDVFEDYIQPVINYLLHDRKLNEYLRNIGNGIRDFISVFSQRIDECGNIYNFRFQNYNHIGHFLIEIIKNVRDEQTILICLKQLWTFAYVFDQWKVQEEIQSVLNDKYITQVIASQFAEFISDSNSLVPLDNVMKVKIPPVVKSAIIESNKRIYEKEI
ncbi:MAG TPA: serine/threonine-protein kinase [Candidatus Cloacimonadota bacterium]|nr:serine/threonine-protein kinase [Candidatus Cloacimonadota bacterium]HPT71694.1 serine/threonine-protein kinase [Candidatus Cloacimonadota bacterium]